MDPTIQNFDNFQVQSAFYIALLTLQLMFFTYVIVLHTARHRLVRCDIHVGFPHYNKIVQLFKLNHLSSTENQIFTMF